MTVEKVCVTGANGRFHWLPSLFRLAWLALTPNCNLIHPLRDGSRPALPWASGFLGAHVVLALLEAGYTVHGTVRSESSASELRKRFAAEIEGGRLVLFVVPDLAAIEKVRQVCQGKLFPLLVFLLGVCKLTLILLGLVGVTSLLHVATPVPRRDMTDAHASILHPSLSTLRSLMAYASSESSELRHIVLTTSLSTHLDGISPIIDETTWNPTVLSDLAAVRKPFAVYMGTKTVVEREAWSTCPPHVALTTIAPTYLAGPVVVGHPVRGSNAELVAALKQWENSKIPGWVDVRDVARAHVEAIRREEAKGRRLLAVGLKRNVEVEAGLIKEVLGVEYTEWEKTLEDFREQVRACGGGEVKV
ncbi:hypothetical protein ACQY0O_000686 [Thecaphora frezii]